jgi:hypothetical protein
MKTILLSLIFFIILSCDNSDDNNSFTQQTITPTLIYKGGFGDLEYNPTQHGVVITTQSDWDNFRNTYWINGLQINEANNVNFNNEMVLLAFDDPKTTTSGTLEVNFNSVIENGNNISVDLEFIGQAGMGQMPSRICNFVKIPKSTKPVVFE